MPSFNFWKFLCGVLLPVLVCAGVARAETTWTEVRSPHFRVLTDGSASQAQNTAAQFEQLRHVFAVQFNDANIGAGAPITIIAARDPDTFKMLEPHAWKATGGNLAGEFHRGWEKQFATVILSSAEMNQVVVFHEYTHSVLHARAHWLPIWMDEGFAEFYGYTRFEKNRTLTGAPSQRAAILRNETLLPVSEMLTWKNDIRDEKKANIFYAEAWAMVHYMMFGPGMGVGAKLNVFFKKLQAGEKQTDAFKEVFGDTKAFDDALYGYVRNFLFKAAIMPADEKVDAKSLPARKLTPAEMEYELGCFQIGAHEVALGRERIEKAISLDPKLAGAHEELAFLAFRAGNDDQAVTEWKQAVSLDPTKARSAFALAMMGVPLKAQSKQQLQETEATLQHVVELSPDFAAPYVDLALVEWRLGKMQAAYTNTSKAEMLEPWRAGYHVLSGNILLAGHQPALAAKDAVFVAERWHGPDHNEAVDLWNQISPKDRGDGAALTLEIPPGTKLEKGTLTEVTCGTKPGEAAVFKLTPDAPGSEPITFKAERFSVGFSDSFWWGEDHYTPCHHLTGHSAMIAYKPDGMQLVSLEVRDDLPAPKPAAATQESGK